MVTKPDLRKGPLRTDRITRYTPEERRALYLAKKKLYSPIAVERKKERQRRLRELREEEE